MTVRRRRVALAGVAILLAGLAVTWRVVRRDGPRYIKRDPAQRVVRVPVVRPHVGPAASLDWLLEPGAPDRRVAGIVLDEHGPVVGARVELRSELTREGVIDVPGVVSGADGRFDLGGQLPARWLLVATAEGKTPVVRQIDLRDPAPESPHDRVIIRMAACLTMLEGRVHDIDGKPLAGARVTEARRGVWWFVPVREVLTDPEGRFRLCGIGSVTTVATVSLEGYASVWLKRIPPVTGWDVTLVPGYRVTGHVRTDDGTPVDGALVTLVTELGGGLGPISQNAMSDTDGRFKFGSVSAGEYRAAADRTGYLFDSFTSVHVTADVTDIVVKMKRCPRRVAGRVMSRGEPVAGAEVALGYVHLTQEDGSFLVPCVPAESADLEVFGWDVVGGRTVPPGHEDLDDLVIEVAPRGEIAGTVLAGGVPVAGAQVLLRDPEAGPRFAMMPYEKNETTTDDAGKYRLRPPRGSYLLAARDPASGARSEEVAVEVAAVATTRTQIDLSLDVVTLVEGVLVDSESRAVPGEVLTLTDGGKRSVLSRRDPAREARTGPNGSFVFRGVLPGSYRVELDDRADDVADWPLVELPRSDSRVTLRLQLRGRSGLTISGRVVDDLGMPVALATVKSNRSGTFTNRQGAFTLPSVVDGVNWITARSPEGGASEQMDAQGGAQDVVVVVPRTGAIEVAVSGFSPGARLVALRQGPRRSAHSGPSPPPATYIARDVELTGTAFVLDGLPPAEYTVEVKDETRVASAKVVVESGKTARVSLSAGAGGTIRGIALEAETGVPVGDAMCSAGTSHATTDATGRFVLSNLPAGQLLVNCMKMTPANLDDMRMSLPVTVDLREGGEVTGVEVEMRGMPPELRP